MPEPNRDRPGEGPEIATRTLAEIYAGQGLHDRALGATYLYGLWEGLARQEAPAEE